MHLLPITEDNVPVAIFSLGEQRMFLPISEDYQVSSGLCIVVVFMYLVVIQGHAQTDR